MRRGTIGLVIMLIYNAVLFRFTPIYSLVNVLWCSTPLYWVPLFSSRSFSSSSSSQKRLVTSRGCLTLLFVPIFENSFDKLFVIVSIRNKTKMRARPLKQQQGCRCTYPCRRVPFSLRACPTSFCHFTSLIMYLNYFVCPALCTATGT